MKYTRPFKQWLAVALLGLAAAAKALAQNEDAVKAAFVYNFAKFVEWPAAAFSDASAPITVAFVGAGSLADTFEQNVKGKNANGREFSIKRLPAAAGAEAAQIVVVGDAGQSGAVLGAVKGKPVLTIGDLDGFNGAIRFVKDGAKIGFELDLDAAKGAGLKVDPKLQKVAKSVKGG